MYLIWGNNGLLALKLTQEQYKEKTGHENETSKQSVKPPIDFNYSMTKNQITQEENKEYHKKYFCEIHSNTNIYLKKKIQDVIKQIYLIPFFYELGGFANKSTLGTIRFIYA